MQKIFRDYSSIGTVTLTLGGVDIEFSGGEMEAVTILLMTPEAEQTPAQTAARKMFAAMGFHVADGELYWCSPDFH